MFIPSYTDIIFFPRFIVDKSGIDYMFGAGIFTWFPLSSSGNNLRFLHNSFFRNYNNVSWHSFPVTKKTQVSASLKFKMLKAVCDSNFEEIERLVKEESFDLNNTTLDKQEKFTAQSLAAYLDNLEVLHLLDLLGAEVSDPKGKF